MAYTYAGQYGPEQTVNASGLPLKSLPITVYLMDGSTLASLYTDRTKATAAANPTTTDALGNLTFFADPGDYIISGNTARLTVALEADPSEPYWAQAQVQTTPGATPFIDWTHYDTVYFTALNANITGFFVPAPPLPVAGDQLTLAFQDDGAGTRSIVFTGTSFENGATISLASVVTTLNTMMVIQFLWNPLTNRWRPILKA